MFEVFNNLWIWTVEGVNCSYSHIVADSKDLGAFAVDAVNNVGQFFCSFIK